MDRRSFLRKSAASLVFLAARGLPVSGLEEVVNEGNDSGEAPDIPSFGVMHTSHVNRYLIENYILRFSSEILDNALEDSLIVKDMVDKLGREFVMAGYALLFDRPLRLVAYGGREVREEVIEEAAQFLQQHQQHVLDLGRYPIIQKNPINYTWHKLVDARTKIVKKLMVHYCRLLEVEGATSYTELVGGAYTDEEGNKNREVYELWESEYLSAERKYFSLLDDAIPFHKKIAFLGISKRVRDSAEKGFAAFSEIFQKEKDRIFPEDN
ncbi:MAG: hypothetical protein ACE5ES_02875 [Candidatus Nanoarchaeia archaeon]